MGVCQQIFVKSWINFVFCPIAQHYGNLAWWHAERCFSGWTSDVGWMDGCTNDVWFGHHLRRRRPLYTRRASRKYCESDSGGGRQRAGRVINCRQKHSASVVDGPVWGSCATSSMCSGCGVTWHRLIKQQLDESQMCGFCWSTRHIEPAI